MSVWHRHPGVRSGDQLTLGERSADRMRNTMGSWGFVGTFLAGMGVWAVVNSIAHLGGAHGFDKYPYVLLNLMLSMLAGLQGAVLLIAAKRQDQIASELAQHDYQTNVESKQVIDAVHELTAEIHKQVVSPPSA